MHAAVSRRRFKIGSSRHAYDLAMLAADGSILSRVDASLFEAVAVQKLTFADDRTGFEALRDGIRLVPDDDARAELARDYAQMRDMIFGDAPPLESVLAALAELELRLRAFTR